MNKVTAFTFSEIENSVLHQEVDAGVIIHENRFTYEAKGLVKIIDLGEYWETQTQLPIPLGGIAIRRNLPRVAQLEVNELIQKSILHARKQESISEFVQCHAQEMDAQVMKAHIDLYVNDHSISLGNIGIEAVDKMKQILNPETQLPLFV